MDKMYDVPKKKNNNLDPMYNGLKKIKNFPGSPNYKNPLAEWVQRQTGKTTTQSGDNSNVDSIYGPIAGSAKQKSKKDITKIPGFKFGRGTE
jgi:hypothetical protein